VSSHQFLIVFDVILHTFAQQSFYEAHSLAVRTNNFQMIVVHSLW